MNARDPSGSVQRICVSLQRGRVSRIEPEHNNAYHHAFRFVCGRSTSANIPPHRMNSARGKLCAVGNCAHHRIYFDTLPQGFHILAVMRLAYVTIAICSLVYTSSLLRNLAPERSAELS
ncbi:hypothetical protein PLICRDRAFT_407007 [Plicaturopsis crispa FD-325 SS-3]|nr:hypothetical protein PLICRDRAFT_407007 [Plicaturopsis crispa FD-325 SS-3]